jgi:hypothetical protein
MAPMLHYLKSVNHNIVTWHASRQYYYRLYSIISLFKGNLSSQVLQHVCQVNIIKLNLSVKQKIQIPIWNNHQSVTTFSEQFSYKMRRIGSLYMLTCDTGIGIQITTNSYGSTKCQCYYVIDLIKHFWYLIQVERQKETATIWQVFWTFWYCRINTIYIHCRLKIKLICTRCETV